MPDVQGAAVLSRRFTSDNAAGVSSSVMEAMTSAAAGMVAPYGADELTGGVTQRLREVFEHDLVVQIVGTGTAANSLALATLIPSWGGVVCHRDAHINNDESGAPEFYTGGAKLIAAGGPGAMITHEALMALLAKGGSDVHTVPPAVLSISQSTEIGSVYPVDVVAELAATAHAAGLATHMDGARFAAALVATGATPAQLTWQAGIDGLSFGATKNGTATAEAVILFDTRHGEELAHRAKRAGLLTSKMRFQSAQLAAYLDDDLWLRNAAHANLMADRLAEGLQGLAGVKVDAASSTNIRFCELPLTVIDGLLSQGFAFYHDRWEPGTVRFVTSFVTTKADIDDLVATIGELCAELAQA